MPRTLLNNSKRSAMFFLASRSKSRSNGGASHSDNTPRNTPKSNDCDQSAGDLPQLQDEQNGAITYLTRELGSLRHDVTQLKSEVMSQKQFQQ